jgi:hypothetical protein
MALFLFVLLILLNAVSFSHVSNFSFTLYTLRRKLDCNSSHRSQALCLQEQILSFAILYFGLCFCSCFVLRLYWFIQAYCSYGHFFMVRIPIELSQNVLQTLKMCKIKYDPKREIHFIHQCIVTLVSKLFMRKYSDNLAWSCITQSILAKPKWTFYM